MAVGSSSFRLQSSTTAKASTRISLALQRTVAVFSGMGAAAHQESELLDKNRVFCAVMPVVSGLLPPGGDLFQFLLGAQGNVRGIIAHEYGDLIGIAGTCGTVFIG